MNKSYIANEIKNQVKMIDLVRFYGFEIKRGNRISCHIHGGKNANLGVKDTYCHCFKCGYNADAIKFVQDYFSLSFSDAVAKINTDFALGLPIDDHFDRRQQTEMARKLFLRKQEQKRKEEEREKYFNALLDTHEEIARLERQKQEYKPKSKKEDPHPKFIEAITNMEYAKYKFNKAEEELYLYDKRNN